MSCKTTDNIECNVFDVGQYNNCGLIEIQIKAKETCIHTLKYTYLGIGRVLQFAARKGEYFTFKNVFNENSTIIFEIFTSDNTAFVYNHYDCTKASTKKYSKFRIQILPVVNQTETCDPCAELEDCIIDNCLIE